MSSRTKRFMWSFERINLSTILVVTGELVDSYNEEFRRLFAHSTIPTALSQKKESCHDQSRYNPYSDRTFERRVSLDQVHIRASRQSGLMTLTGQQKGLRYNNGQTLMRGLSIQDRLNQAHCANPGALLKVHSYAGDLSQTGNQTTHFRTLNDSQHYSERGRCTEESLLHSRMNRYMQKKTYCVDRHQLLPSSSETSLNLWKINSYLNKRDTTMVESVENLQLSDALPNHNASFRMRTLMHVNDRPAEKSEHHCNIFANSGTSRPGSQTVASPNDSPSIVQQQWTSARLRENQTRLEEIRRNRSSFHEEPSCKLRPDHNQGTQRLSIFDALERSKGRLPEGGLDKRYSLGTLEGYYHQGPSSHREELIPESQQDEDNRLRDQTNAQLKLTDAQRSVSHFDLTAKTERRNSIENWQEPLSRTTSVTQLGIKLKEPLLQPAKLRPAGLNAESSKHVTSLIRIPEERDGPTARNYDSTDQLANSVVSVLCKDKGETFQRENPMYHWTECCTRKSEEKSKDIIHLDLHIKRQVQRR
ncbi:hypothetical protein DPEC_G00175250 [Dallia pectoralis]|uniref:Uncharacterized protein n=1 Tax=Dallia pectoralis TaxID=75939 RepID=A0ACC2GER2_DALPE|nr:hypothetical protein DPEC_G00175250 [Dallia pectoralis]